MKQQREFKINWFFVTASIVGLLLMLFLGWITYAYADIYTLGDTVGTEASTGAYRIWGLGTGISGTLTQVVSYGTNMSFAGNIYIQRCNSEVTSGASYDCAGSVQTGVMAGGTETADRITSGTLSLVADPTKWYYIRWDDAPSDARLAGWSSNVYTEDWQQWRNYGDMSLTYATFTGVYEPKIALIGWTSPDLPSSELSDSISFVHPTATTTQDFSQWIVHYEIVSTLDPQFLHFKFLSGTSTLQTTSVWFAGDPIEETIPLTKTQSLPTGTSTVTVEIWNATDTTKIAESESVTFVISTLGVEESWNTYVEENFASTSTPTSTITMEQTCNPDDAWYVYGFCRVLKFFFVPFNFDSKISELGNALQNKAPIAYYTMAKEKFDELTTIVATGTKPQIAFANISFDGNSSSSLSFFDPDEAVALAGTGNWNTLKTIILSGLWISFLIYLIVRGITFFQGHRRHL